MTQIRSHPSLFQRFQSHSDLVNLLNLFANTAIELPYGWTSKTDAAEKVCFVRIILIKGISYCFKGEV